MVSDDEIVARVLRAIATVGRGEASVASAGEQLLSDLLAQAKARGVLREVAAPGLEHG